MLEKYLFSTVSNTAVTLVFAGALLGIFTPITCWAMNVEENIEGKEKWKIIRVRPEPKSALDLLPSNLFGKIFSYLTVQDLGANMPLVSKKFYYEAQQNYCWMDRLPNIKSKNDYVEFVQVPLMTFYNFSPPISGKVNFVYKDPNGSFSTYPTQDQEEFKFNIYSVNVKLPRNKETVIRVSCLPDNLKVLYSDKICGVQDFQHSLINPPVNTEKLLKERGININLLKRGETTAVYYREVAFNMHSKMIQTTDNECRRMIVMSPKDKKFVLSEWGIGIDPNSARKSSEKNIIINVGDQTSTTIIEERDETYDLRVQELKKEYNENMK